ncbi:hypothetical protein ES705_07634 [subsurface metagenome]
MLSKRIFVLVSLLLSLFLLVGCGLTTPLTVDNQAPVITSIAVTEAEVGILYTYYVEANDPDGDALTYSLIRNPSGMEINEDTGVITWTPNSAGSFGVTVKVSDGVLYDTQSFTITITPVAELTGIVVIPDPMDLEVGETGFLEVTANYSFGDPKEVTNACVYTLTQPTTGVVTVTAGIVTTVGVGTDTIFISYTEGVTATAEIAVTVSRVRIPMEITVDLPTFTVGESYWFTINMIPNDDSGKPVKASFGWPISIEEVKIEGTLETDVVSGVTFTLIGDNVFETDEFAMEDIIVNFRGTFMSPGMYQTTITVFPSSGGDSLCSKEITIIVEGDLQVGDNYGGGIVVYTDGIGHGLIAATADQSSEDGIIWAIVDYQSTKIGTLTTIGSGSVNTDLIIERNGGDSTYAAGLARAYNGGGYTDWFLPSKDELNELWVNRELVGGFTNGTYWSSSEYSSENRGWNQDFFTGFQVDVLKSSPHKVRAVRAF